MLSLLLYNEIIYYCKKRCNLKRASDIYPHLDLAHDVICDDKYHTDDYKVIVDRLIYKRVSESRVKKVGLDQAYIKIDFVAEEIWLCAACNNEYPKYKFHLSWKICDGCYRDKNRVRIKENNLKSYYKHHEKRLKEKKEYDKKYRAENLDKVRKRERERYHNKKKNENNNS